jgi:hypothetical protein
MRLTLAPAVLAWGIAGAHPRLRSSLRGVRGRGAPHRSPQAGLVLPHASRRGRRRTCHANRRAVVTPCAQSCVRLTPHASKPTTMPGQNVPRDPPPPMAGDRGVFGPCEATPATNSSPAPLRPLTKTSRDAAPRPRLASRAPARTTVRRGSIAVSKQGGGIQLPRSGLAPRGGRIGRRVSRRWRRAPGPD